MQNAINANPTSASASAAHLLSSSPRNPVTGAGGVKNRDSLQRKQVWYLPYLVLEFDKNEVLVDALGGGLDSAVWMYTASFDVSRVSDIGLTAYLRTQHPGLEAKKGESSGSSSGGGGAGGEGQDMGNSDLCMGGVRFTPDLEQGVSRDHHI